MTKDKALDTLVEYIIQAIREDRESYELHDPSDIQAASQSALEGLLEAIRDPEDKLSEYIFARVSEAT